MMALVTGGASSGKSAYAENLCTELGGNLVYLAAMRPYGEEGARRIARHRAARAGKGFTTLECYEGLGAVVQGGGADGATALLECLGNVVANELFGDGSAKQGERGHDEVLRAVERDVDELVRRCAHVVVVGNEVGADGVAYDEGTVRYQRLIGELSQRIAARSDIVVECVCGLPVTLRAPRGLALP